MSFVEGLTAGLVILIINLSEAGFRASVGDGWCCPDQLVIIMFAIYHCYYMSYTLPH